MASGVQDTDVRKVPREEVYELEEGGFPGVPAVRVEGVEEEGPNQTSSETKQDAASDSKKLHDVTSTHETENVKTTTTTEAEDVPKPSIKEKVKEKYSQVEDKLRPKDATHAKKADPHPSLV